MASEIIVVRIHTVECCVVQCRHVVMSVLFNHRGVDYYKGDFVALLGSNSSPWIAQIVSHESFPIEDSGGNGMGVKVLWAWYPEEFKSELFPDLDTTYYSQYEVILSKFSDLNPLDSIITKVTILHYDQFVHLDEYPLKVDNIYKTMFYRQTFDDKGLTPLLPLECNALFGIGDWKLVPRNPDLVYYKCKICDVIYQRPVERTFKQRPSDPDITITCSNCLSCVQGTTPSADVKGDKRPKRILRLESYRKRTIVDSDSDSPVDAGQVIDEDDDEYKVDFDSAKRIKSTKSGGHAVRFSATKLNSFEKQIFTTAVEKIHECLSKGVAEMQSKNVKLSVNVMYLAEKIIQSLMDVYGVNSREFKQRLYEIYTNLKRDINSDLRRRVICGKLPIHKLITIETRFLAPPDLIAEREKERDKHFARNVLIPITHTQNDTTITSEKIDTSSTPDNVAKSPEIKISDYHIDAMYNRAVERLNKLPIDYQKPFRSVLDCAVERVRRLLET